MRIPRFDDLGIRSGTLASMVVLRAVNALTNDPLDVDLSPAWPFRRSLTFAEVRYRVAKHLGLRPGRVHLLRYLVRHQDDKR